MTSLATRITALAGVLAATTALMFALVARSYVADLIEERSLRELASEAQLLAPKLANAMAQMGSDLAVLQQVPPIEGIQRSTRNSGIDPVDGSTLPTWKSRLSVIFDALLRARPNYLQVRYIGVADDGRELVRVDRAADGGIVVRGDMDMQSKDHRPYFLDSLHLAADVTRFSEVSRNVEHRQVVPTDPATIRASRVVSGIDGAAFGILVINADFAALAGSAIDSTQARFVTEIFDGAGNNLRLRPGLVNPEFTWAESASPLARDLRSAAGSSGFVSVTEGGVDLRAHYQDIELGASNGSRLRVASIVPADELFVGLDSLDQLSWAISLGMVLVATLAGLLLGRRVAQPLQQLATAMQRYAETDQLVGLPDQDETEIGLVTHQLETLVGDLAQTRRSERAHYTRLKATLDHSVDGVITMDASGTVTSFNPACELLFGYVEEEVVGRNVAMLMPRSVAEQHDTFLADYRENREQRIIGRVREVMARRKDGTECPVELSVSEVELPGGTIFSGILRDVTARKVADGLLQETIAQLSDTNKQLTSTNERLDQSNRDVRSLAYIVSHDLRAPLINVLAFSAELTELVQTLVDRQQDAADEELTELAENTIPKVLGFITESAEKMDQKLTFVLKLSRLGRYEMKPEQVDLDEAFQSALEGCATPDDRQCVTIDGQLGQVCIDREAVGIIATNLLTNALKYRHPDRELAITISATRTDAGIIIAVTDNGRGIAEPNLEDVFVLFRRVGAQDTKGEGIGLAYCSTLANRLGGRIWCDSVLGEGSTFYFFLPQQVASRVTEAA